MPTLMRSFWQTRRLTLIMMVVILLASIGLFGVGIRTLSRFFRPPVYRFHMLTDAVPNRQILARRLASEASKHGVLIELTARSYPSLEGLKLVNAPNEINMALAPGGVGRPEQFPDVRQVAALGTDPLHVMVRADLYESVAKSLGALKGKRINCGPYGSVLRVLAHDVLKFAGLTPPTPSSPGDFNDESITSQDLLARLDRLKGMPAADRARAVAALPDAIVFLSPLPSLLAKRLVSASDYRLVPLPFTEAYALDRLNLDDLQGTQDLVAKVDRASIVSTTIPPDLYGTDPPVPPAPCTTLGSRLLLVAYSKTDPEAVARLLQVVYESPFTGLIQPPPLQEQIAQFEIHSGTELYLRRRQPFLTPEMMSQVGKLTGGLGAFASGLLGLYGFLRILQLRRFEAYYHEVRRIVRVSRGQEDDPRAPANPEARRAYLLDQLDDLKSEAVRDFAEGGLKGEGLLAGVVALINDTRNSLASARRTDPLDSMPFDGRSVDIRQPLETS